MALAVAVPSFVLARTADAAASGPAPARMPVDPASCVATAMTGFGEAPADQLQGGSCRRFTVAANGTYLARVADADNKTLASAVYGGDSLACAVAWCNLGAGTYYLVAEPGAAEPHTEPFRATVVDLKGAGCEAVAAQGFSTAYRGTFASQGEVRCLNLPDAPGRYQVTLAPEDPNRPMVQLIQDGDARPCASGPVTDPRGCELDIPGSASLIVVSQDPRTTGEYRVAVQRTTGANECADMSPGVPGAPGHATVALSGTDFVTCFDLPDGGSGSDEVLTLDRVEGDGTAWLSVYDFDGRLVCQDTVAAAYQQLGCGLGSARHMVVVRSATGSGRYRISQVTAISENCSAPISTAFGGPATAGSIGVSGDVRCYRVPANSWIGAQSGGDTPTIRQFGEDGGLYTCSALPCMVRSTEVIVAAAKPVDFRLDTWAVGYDYAAPADCGVITETTAYGFGPVAGTLSADDRAHCVSVPTGLYDEFRLTTENAEPYVINGDGGIVRCDQDGTAWTCLPKPSQGGHRALVAFIAERAGPFRAEADCVTVVRLCNNANFVIGSGPPYVLTAGATATFTIFGAALHRQDTLWLTRGGEKVTPIAVRSVSANRDFYTVDIDLTRVEPGRYDLEATSYSTPQRPFTNDEAVVVQPTQLTVAAKPSISGKAAVGVKVTVNPGVWSPAVEYYQYQWAANGVPIARATASSYTIPAELRGKRLTVTVTGRHANHRENVATSAALTVGYGVAPKATAKPKIVGTVKVGKTVKISSGAWSPKPTSYRYEWRVNGKLVATTGRLKLKKSWSGKKLTLTVVAKRAGHYDGRAVSATVKIKK
ncbi:hypothetical protein ACIBSW_04540 [Actinoplanes sp. NPDC049668]|uniref:hypothetical protein n=1 Tax=unclassified Actinoplanes TaxID=2626549 RepID=UPI0033BB2A09